MSDEDRVSMVPSPKIKTETKTCKNGSWDVSRLRLKFWEFQVCP